MVRGTGKDNGATGRAIEEDSKDNGSPDVGRLTQPAPCYKVAVYAWDKKGRVFCISRRRGFVSRRWGLMLRIDTGDERPLW